jgi:anti-anti-sigma factor
MHQQHRGTMADSGEFAVVGEPERRAPGAFAVRTERRTDVLVLWLSGELNRATSVLLDRELDAQAGQTTRVVVDLTGLEFIDSIGLETLVRTHRRATERDQRLSFRQGLHVAQRPLELTRDVQLRSRPPSRRGNVNDDDDLFTRAMACAAVDHQRPRDRPLGHRGRVPRPGRSASDAPTLPSVARAAPPTRGRFAPGDPPGLGPAAQSPSSVCARSVSPPLT